MDRLRMYVVTTVVASVLAPAAGAKTTTVGANLALPANNPIRCQDGFPIQTNPTFPQPFYGPMGSTSCAIISYSPTPNLGPGVALSADLKVGEKTGPMRFVVLRTLAAAGAGSQCCSVERYGNVFTPRANGITRVPLNLPLDADTDVTTGIIYGDGMGLEVLAPDVPIPATLTNNGGQDVAVPDYEWWPAFSAQGIPAPSPTLVNYGGSYSDVLLLFRLNYLTGGAGPLAQFSGDTFPIVGNAFGIPITCQVLDCRGDAVIQSIRTGTAASRQARAARAATLAKGRVSIRRGRKGKVTVTLTKAGRSYVKKHRHAKLWLNVTLGSGRLKRVQSHQFRVR